MRKLVYLLLLSCMVFVHPAIATPSDLNSIKLKTFPDSSSVSLSTLPAGKPLYIKMWATWCKPCMEQMPHFQELHERYGDEVNFVAVNIDINEKPEAIHSVINRFDLTMPVWVDTQGQLATELGLVGTPFSVLMNSQGQQVYTTHESDQALDGFIQRLAEGQQLPAATVDTLSAAEKEHLLSPYLEGEHYLFFTATWCDWYLAESRPAMAERCENAQHGLNNLVSMAPEGNWTGIVNHLWTDDKALAEFNTKYNMEVPFEIDQNGVLFQKFNVRNIPVLLKIKDGKVVTKIEDFSDPEVISEQLKAAN